MIDLAIHGVTQILKCESEIGENLGEVTRIGIINDDGGVVVINLFHHGKIDFVNHKNYGEFIGHLTGREKMQEPK